MKRKIFMVSAIVLAIGSAFVTKANNSKLFTTYYKNPSCTPIADCNGGTVSCSYFSDPQCLTPVSPKRTN